MSIALDSAGSQNGKKKDDRQYRILTLDGGGVRGLVSVEVLHRVELLLRQQTGDANLLLCDWFDWIAGTSTGAIAGTLLATGFPVADLRRFYEDEAAQLFEPSSLRERWRYRYRAEYLATRLQNVLGEETTLGSDSIKTLLMLVLRNATTDSPWFVTNNPAAKFNDRSFPGCNLDLPLWRLVRASTAAPSYFEPEVITIGEETFIFSDGGVTGYNNPAFQSFLMTTVEPFGLCWPAGEKNILLVSVGTGSRALRQEDLNPSGMHLLYHAQTIPLALMNAAAYQQDLLCRVFGKCLVGNPLDLEVGDLIGARGPVQPKLFTYLRYDVELTREGLQQIGCGDIDPEPLPFLDRVQNLPELQKIGTALADHSVRPEHFEGF